MKTSCPLAKIVEIFSVCAILHLQRRTKYLLRLTNITNARYLKFCSFQFIWKIVMTYRYFTGIMIWLIDSVWSMFVCYACYLKSISVQCFFPWLKYYGYFYDRGQVFLIMSKNLIDLDIKQHYSCIKNKLISRSSWSIFLWPVKDHRRKLHTLLIYFLFDSNTPFR